MNRVYPEQQLRPLDHPEQQHIIPISLHPFTYNGYSPLVYLGGDIASFPKEINSSHHIQDALTE